MYDFIYCYKQSYKISNSSPNFMTTCWYLYTNGCNWWKRLEPEKSWSYGGMLDTSWYSHLLVFANKTTSAVYHLFEVRPVSQSASWRQDRLCSWFARLFLYKAAWLHRGDITRSSGRICMTGRVRTTRH